MFHLSGFLISTAALQMKVLHFSSSNIRNFSSWKSNNDVIILIHDVSLDASLIGFMIFTVFSAVSEGESALEEE